jgi:hypothetical protein
MSRINACAAPAASVSRETEKPINQFFPDLIGD